MNTRPVLDIATRIPMPDKTRDGLASLRRVVAAHVSLPV